MKRRSEGAEYASEDAVKVRRSDWDLLPGMIISVHLKNFMCHQEFVYRPTPRVNFVAGINGSGKSAVLTGVLVALGAKAKDVGKSSPKDFIREGSDSCSVEVTLVNRGENSYRNELYGDSLTVHRSIGVSGGSYYKFKDAKGRIQPIKKPSKELARMLSVFSIQITNPVTILMQETAKTLLKDANEKKLYTFFMLATQLEDCKKFYNSANEKMFEATRRLEDTDKYKEELEREFKVWKKKYDFLQSVESRRKEIRDMKAELAWSVVFKFEKEEGSLNKDISGAKTKVRKYEEVIAEKSEEQVEAKNKKSVAEEELTTAKNTANEREKARNNAKRAYDTSDSKVKTCKRYLNEFKTKLKDTDKEIADLKGSIKKCKENGVRDYEEKCRIREQQKKKIGESLSAYNSKIDSTQTHLNNIELSIKKAQGKIRDLKHEASGLNSRLKVSETEIENVKTKKNNRYAVYGKDMINLCQEIEKNARKFEKKPVGPLGAFLKFKPKTTNVQKGLIESEIQNMSTSFIFDNYRDKLLFEKISSRFNFKGGKYIFKFKEEIYDVSQKRVKCKEFPTIFDLLDFDNPNVANCLIDHKKIERILLFPDDLSAQSLLSTNPPKNIHYGAVSNDGFVTTYHVSPYRTYFGKRFPRPVIQSSVEEHLKNLARECNEFKKELTPILGQIEELNNNELKLHYEERKANEGVIEKISKEMRNKQNELSRIISEEKTEALPDIAAFQEDLEKSEEKKEEYDKEIEDKKNELKDLQDASLELLEELNKREAECTSNCIENFEKKVYQCKKEIDQIERDKNRSHNKKEELLKNIKENEAKRKKLLENIENHTKKAEQWNEERVETERNSEDIYNKIQAAEKSLKERQEKVKETPQKIMKQYGMIGNLFRDVTQKCIDLKDKINRLSETLEIRKQGFVEIRKSVCRRIKMAFAMRLSARNYAGELTFHHKENSLDMYVNPDPTAKSKRGLKTLSGGEKSYSTVALILALWDSMHPPFRIMDEFDVFMDMMNRRVALDLIISIATDARKYQHIFLTPLNIDNVQVNDDVSILRLQKNLG